MSADVAQRLGSIAGIASQASSLCSHTSLARFATVSEPLCMGCSDGFEAIWGFRPVLLEIHKKNTTGSAKEAGPFVPHCQNKSHFGVDDIRKKPSS